MSKNHRIAVLSLEMGKGLECHSWHYAPFIAECDAAVMHDTYPNIFFWFTDGGHWDTLSRIERVPGFEIVKVWDIQNTERAGHLARFLNGKPKVCSKLEETFDGIDAAFIFDGGGDGTLHLEHVKPFLERKIPVFIDKPFANTYADAQAMVELARTNETPLFTASILSHVNEIGHFKSRWREIPPPGVGVVKGVGPSLGAVIHTLALAQGVFGTGVEWVECMGTPPPEALSLTREDLAGAGPFAVGDLPLEVMMLRYPDERQVIVLNTRYDRMDWFSCEVWSATQRRNPPPRMHMRSLEIGDPEYIGGTFNIVKLLKQMLDTGEPPVPYETPLELIAIVEAGREAQRTRRRVYLREFLQS